MEIRRRLVVLVMAVVTAACAAERGPGAPAAPLEAEPAEPWGKPMLPAYETSAEKRIGKADWYDDYRNSHLDIYGITEAPSVAHRPFAEWEPAEALILVYSSSTLPAAVRQNFVDIIAAARNVVDIHVVYDSTQAYNSLSGSLTQAGIPSSAVTWVNLANDSIWARDFGPISILAGTKVGIIDARYYHQRYNDDAIPTLLPGNQWGLTTYRVPLDMEGGNFMSDTAGRCWTSQGMFWYNGTSEANVVSYMEDWFGCTDVGVVQPMDGEGTTHIDMQAKFLTNQVVVVGQYTAAQDSTNKAITDSNAALFAAAGYTVKRIPMPNNQDGVFRSYTNSLLVNGVHIVPVYSGYSSMQAQALAVYQEALPGWTHVTSNSDTIITWAGAIHCITKLVHAGQWTPLEADPEVICDSYDCYPGGTATGCGDVTFEGCCEGNQLKYCENNQLVQQTCNPGTCGWDAQNGYYNCGTSGGSDPSGQHPKACDGGCTPSCAGKQCGPDGCGGSCGTCPAGQTCSVAGLCTSPCVPSCTGKECGPDGCGGVCGTCSAGETCSAAGLCQAAPDACGDITFEGCCNGNTLYWCENNQVNTYNCQAGTCGWSAQQQFYNCGTSGGADPSGTHPKNCDDLGCQPDCTGKECGSDGCDGICGLCAPAEVCTAGQCVPSCTPSCTGKECGPDGCGGVCGTCPAGETCAAGQCTPGPCVPACAGKVCGNDGCGGSCGTCAQGQLCTPQGQCVTTSECGSVTYAGYCDGNTLIWCESGKLYSADCAAFGSYVCLWVAASQGYFCVYQSPCQPDCVAKECGDDGCGGSCGACPQGMSCDGGTCIPGPCQPDCAGKQCGDDGCGDPCGTCGAGFHCHQFLCLPDCVPACGGKECGADGCGGSCGSCPQGMTCIGGSCGTGPCEPDCSDAECGSDGCDGSCGTCAAGEACVGGACEQACEPACGDAVCGPDGCGGSCGTCPPGSTCQEGSCEAGCEPDCAGKECGPDGCGGSCGTCVPGASCQNGLCAQGCTPLCTDRECGDDGCGGSCGICPKGWSCDAVTGSCSEVAADECGNVTEAGVCLEGNVLARCVAGALVETDCDDDGGLCAYVPEAGRYDCVQEETPGADVTTGGDIIPDAPAGDTGGTGPTGEGRVGNGGCTSTPGGSSPSFLLALLGIPYLLRVRRSRPAAA